jgi:hypothetical protein
MTILLFIFLVFSSSTIVLFFYPDIINPDPTMLSSSSAPFTSSHTFSHSFGFGFGIGGFNFYSYDFTMLPTVVKDFVKVAAATLLDLDLGIWSGGSAPATSPPARQRYSSGRRPTTGAGRFKTTVQADRWGNVIATAPRTFATPQSLLARLFARFMLGLSTLGILSFLQMLMSMSLFAPLQLVSGRLFRQRRRDNNGARGGLEGTAALMIGVFVAIGVLRCV